MRVKLRTSLYFKAIAFLKMSLLKPEFPSPFHRVDPLFCVMTFITVFGRP
jgi:hypothetical protein